VEAARSELVRRAFIPRPGTSPKAPDRR